MVQPRCSLFLQDTGTGGLPSLSLHQISVGVKPLQLGGHHKDEQLRWWHDPLCCCGVTSPRSQDIVL